jgi:hypothetical protein
MTLQIAKSLYVIANCHCLPLADALSLTVTGSNTDFVDVTFANEPHMLAKIDALLSAEASGKVFSFNLSDQFGPIATPALRSHLGDRLVTFTNIHFNGLHPDITYIGTLGRRVTGFFGDYHSKIVLFSYVTGRSVSDCLQLFNSTTYGKLSFFDAFGTAKAELAHRDESCDVKFASTFFEMIVREPCLYTVNHPTGPVFLEIARQLAAHTGLNYIPVGNVNFQNHLSNNYIWPVYDEIAEYHDLAYRASPYFFAPNRRTSRAYDLQEFVEGCYVAYEQADPVEFRTMVAKLDFYRHFLKALG